MTKAGPENSCQIQTDGFGGIIALLESFPEAQTMPHEMESHTERPHAKVFVAHPVGMWYKHGGGRWYPWIVRLTPRSRGRMGDKKGCRIMEVAELKTVIDELAARVEDIRDWL
jgi:hypothetical protein